MRDSIITSARRPEVRAAEAEFHLRGARRDLAAARRWNLVLFGLLLIGGAAWALW